MSTQKIYRLNHGSLLSEKRKSAGYRAKGLLIKSGVDTKKPPCYCKVAENLERVEGIEPS